MQLDNRIVYNKKTGTIVYQTGSASSSRTVSYFVAP